MSSANSSDGVALLKSDEKTGLRPGEFKFYAMISAFLVSMLLLSNLMSSAKFISLSWIPGLSWVNLSGSAIVYPMVFLGGDVLTEVYGYSRTRRVIWAGFAVFLVSTVLVYLVGIWPNASFWNDQESYDKVFGAVPRILLGSFISYLIGEFANSMVLAKMKVYMHRVFANQNSFGAMSSRFILSTFVGQFFDSIVFFPIAFYGILPTADLIALVICSWLFKTIWEAIFVPFTVPFVIYLKRLESEDYLDEKTDFTPWHVE